MFKAMLAAAIAGGLLGAALSGTSAAEALAVKIDNFTFAAPRVTVKTGTTVTWTNDDDIPHTVTSTSLVFRSGALDTGDTFSFTFTTPGTYEYFCTLHPHMTGTIVVEAASRDGPAP